MHNNIIMFIGQDMCGKTEISTQLASLFGWQYYKNSDEFSIFTNPSYSADDMVKYSTPAILNFLKQCNFQNNGIILDRSVPCHFAYSKALNRQFDEELLWKFDEEFANLNAKIILCYKTKYTNFNDEYVTEDIQLDVLKYYKEYLTKTKMKYIEICTDSEDLVQEFGQIFKSGILFDDMEEEKTDEKLKEEKDA